MYVVTGGLGFIGSNLVLGLNRLGIDNVLIVDDLSREEQFANLSGAKIVDSMDRLEFRKRIETGAFGENLGAIFHQGACTDTLENDSHYMMENNYEYSKVVLDFALKTKTPLVYASSAAVYGRTGRFYEDPINEIPLNIYGHSKLKFDQHVRRILPTAESTVVGLRYFNAYGPNEEHKGRMTSTIYQFYMQLKKDCRMRLFGASHGYGDGEQRRDFVFVDDLVAMNLFFLEKAFCTGIFNAGTGSDHTFNDVARILVSLSGGGEIEYIDFPVELGDKYQAYTQADLTNLRDVAGYDLEFTTLEEGIRSYFGELEKRARSEEKRGGKIALKG